MQDDSTQPLTPGPEQPIAPTPDLPGRVAAAIREQPGWGALLFVALAVLCMLVLAAPAVGLAQHFHAPDYVKFAAGELAQALGVIAATAVMAAIERRSFWSYGLQRIAAGRRFWAGAAWGLASLTIMLLAMRATGHFFFGGFAERASLAVAFGVFWLVFFLVVGVFEELCFRGYLQQTLARGLGFWPAALLLSALFGFSHKSNSGESAYGIVAAGLFGLFLCLTLKRTGSLWWAIGFHIAWDYAESFLYSVPDSGQMVTGHLLRSQFSGPAWITGGTVGPEGSYFIFPLLGCMALIFAFVYPGEQPAPKTPSL